MLNNPNFKIIYEAESDYRSEKFAVKIMTGASQSVHNILTALSVTDPQERTKLWALLMEQVKESQSRGFVNQLSTAPSTIYYQDFAYWVEKQSRTILFTLMFGFRLRGKPRMGQLRGDMINLIVNGDELDDAKWKVYHARNAEQLPSVEMNVKDVNSEGEPETST